MTRFARAVGLTAVNEARLLGRDPVSLLMLVLAPVVIMTVAGYSLGALYGAGGQTATVGVVDVDGRVFDALARATPDDSQLRLARASDLAALRRRIVRTGEAPIAIEVPPGTADALAAGRPAALVLYVDAARRLEVNALELALGAVQRRAAAAARAEVDAAVRRGVRALRHALRHVERAVARERRHGRARLAAVESRLVAHLEARLAAALAERRNDVAAALRRATDGAHAAIAAQLAERAVALDRVGARLRALADARAAWERWLADLRARAGRHAADIPPPPPLPELPADTDVAVLTKPVEPPAFTLRVATSDTGPAVAAAAAEARALVTREFDALGDASAVPLETTLDVGDAPAFPGMLDATERPAVDGASVRANAFDQYVPGFGVTFLLIGMMLGISLTLFDERDWGTLERVRAGGASLAGILVGKVLARALVGVAQMIVLFGVGWAVFDVALGRVPAALLLPTLAMSCAGAALGLVIPTLAPAHDSVMPLGTMTSLALAAVGGCWWPLDFEPPWMRAIARWLPTTWTMQAFNDLMIRGAPPSAAVVPFVATMAIAVVVLAIGLAAAMWTRGVRR